jgi:hypothetical protein
LEYSGKFFSKKREKLLTLDVAITHGSYLAFTVEINVIMKTNSHLILVNVHEFCGSIERDQYILDTELMLNIVILFL